MFDLPWAVDHMPLVWQHASLPDGMCLDCHRHPEKYVRPQEEVFDMEYQPPFRSNGIGQETHEGIQDQSFTHCSTCHR
jgi:hypothetical protein